MNIKRGDLKKFSPCGDLTKKQYVRNLKNSINLVLKVKITNSLSHEYLQRSDQKK